MTGARLIDHPNHDRFLSAAVAANEAGDHHAAGVLFRAAAWMPDDLADSGYCAAVQRACGDTSDADALAFATAEVAR